MMTRQEVMEAESCGTSTCRGPSQVLQEMAEHEGGGAAEGRPTAGVNCSPRSCTAELGPCPLSLPAPCCEALRDRQQSFRGDASPLSALCMQEC